MAKRDNKKPSDKRIKAKIAERGIWTVHRGKLVPPPGRPGSIVSLFRVIAEKIPFEFLDDLATDMKKEGLTREGIYLAHDSMGAVRYAGRGNIFARLRTRKKLHPLQLHYFSFYVIPNKKHEREIETLVIRATGHLLDFNTQKKHPDIQPGNIRDYEAGTRFYERHRKKGKQKKVKRRRKHQLSRQ